MTGIKMGYVYQTYIMKKLLCLSIILSAIVIACTPKASPAATDVTIPISSKVRTDKASIEAGHTLWTTSCAKCHKAKDVSDDTYEELRPVLASMVKKAKLNTTEVDQVAAYAFTQAKK